VTAIPPSRKWIRAATAAFALALALVSLSPPGKEDSVLGAWEAATSPTLNNALHVPVYLVLTVLAVGCLSTPTWGRILGAAVLCTAYGGALELGQAYIPGRTGSVTDLLLNALGVALGIAGAGLWRRQRGLAGESAPLMDLAPVHDATANPRPVDHRLQKCWKMVTEHYHSRGWRHASQKYEDILADVLWQGASVLDVGCGRHFPMADFFLGCGAEPHGIDPVADETGTARSGVVLKRTTANCVPYPDNTFDVIATRSVLEHLEDPATVFAEFHRVLKPNGLVIFLTPNKYDYVSIFASIIPNRWHGKIVEHFEGRDGDDTFPTFYRANTIRRIKQLARRTGFAVEDIRYHSEYPSMFMRHPVLCRAAIAYDELITRFPLLHWLRGWLLGTARSTKAISPVDATSGDVHARDKGT